MLIKLFIDDTFPIQPTKGIPQQEEPAKEEGEEQPHDATSRTLSETGSPRREERRKMMIMWLVQDNLPLAHDRQKKALVQALHQPLEAAAGVKLEELYWSLSSQLLDATKSPLELRLSAGCVINVTANPPTPRYVNRRTVVEGEEPGSPRDDPDETRVTSGTDDEEYVAEECGWFPFTYSLDPIGQKVASFINPDLEPREDDVNPQLQRLCEHCSTVVSRGESLPVRVDKHYKPMLMSTDSAEGWVEKLGGGTISRWQRRYLIASEKSIDWYSEKPKVGKKELIKGNRYFNDGKTCVAELIENPDPGKYPKCKEPKFFHFGVAFKDQKTMLFRCTSIADKNRFVGFIKSTLGRIETKGASRDPVFWKKWCDALLTSSSDVGELSTRNDAENDRLAEEIADLESQLKELQDKKPELEKQRVMRVTAVRMLQEELEVEEAKITTALGEAERAEQKVAEEQEAFRRQEQAMDEEMRQTAMMEHLTRTQCEEARRRIAELDVDLHQLKERHDMLFARWRKFEEHHTEQETGEYGTHSRLFSFSIDGVPRGMSSGSNWRSESQVSNQNSVVRSTTSRGGSLQASVDPRILPGSKAPRVQRANEIMSPMKAMPAANSQPHGGLEGGASPVPRNPKTGRLL